EVAALTDQKPSLDASLQEILRLAVEPLPIPGNDPVAWIYYLRKAAISYACRVERYWCSLRHWLSTGARKAIEGWCEDDELACRQLEEFKVELMALALPSDQTERAMNGVPESSASHLDPLPCPLCLDPLPCTVRFADMLDGAAIATACGKNKESERAAE